jgi:hypothetical protein
MKDIGTWWFLLGGARVVCECDLNSLGVGAEKLGKYAKSYSDRIAKTGFVGFGISYLGVIGIYYVGTQPLAIYSILAGISFVLSTTGILGLVHSLSGVRQLLDCRVPVSIAY